MALTYDEARPVTSIPLDGRSGSSAAVVWSDEDVIYHAGARDAAARPAAELLAVMKRLVDVGCTAPSRVTQGPFGPELHWDRIGKLTYSWEWPVEGWRAAGLVALRTLATLKNDGLTLSDFQPSDIVMAGCQPILVNLRSLTNWSPSSEAASVETIRRHFLRPLRCAVQGHARLVRKLLRGGPYGVSADDEAVILGERCDDTGSLSETIRQVEELHVPQQPATNVWERYEARVESRYLDEGSAKAAVVQSVISRLKPTSVLDVACNAGRYARMAAASGATVTGLDGDEWCMNAFFSRAAAHGNLAAVVTDMRDPPTTRGWGQGWSVPLERRLSSDLVMMLAFLHHLVLKMHIGTDELRALFEGLATRWLLLEVAPRIPTEGVDPSFYTLEWVLAAIGGHFVKEECWYHGGRGRCLILLRRV